MESAVQEAEEERSSLKCKVKEAPVPSGHGAGAQKTGPGSSKSPLNFADFERIFICIYPSASRSIVRYPGL